MEKRLFKPGDRVQTRGEQQVMTVQRYARGYSPIIGFYESNHLVECTWYDKKAGVYKRKVIHQKNLMKVNGGNLMLNTHSQSFSGKS